MTSTEDALKGVRLILDDIKEATLVSGGYRLSESDTRMKLLDPLIVALGYRKLTDIRCEVMIPATHEMLDYQLFVDGDPRLIIEAKAFDHKLTEADAAQAVQYANILGTEWAVVTNAREWRLYHAFVHGNLADKLVFAFDLLAVDDPLHPELFEQLWLTGKEAFQRGSLDTWLQNRELDLAIRAILADPKSIAIRGMHKQLVGQGVKASQQEIAAWFTRNLPSAVVAPKVVAPRSLPAPVPSPGPVGVGLPSAGPGLVEVSMTSRRVDAHGTYNPVTKRLKISAGSRVLLRELPSLAPEIIERRRQCVADGTFGNDGSDADYFVLVRDLECKTPSFAAALAAGASESGPRAWIMKDGRSLEAIVPPKGKAARVHA